MSWYGHTALSALLVAVLAGCSQMHEPAGNEEVLEDSSEDVAMLDVNHDLPDLLEILASDVPMDLDDGHVATDVDIELPKDNVSDDGDTFAGECTLATVREVCPLGQGCVSGTCAPCQNALDCAIGDACRLGVCGPCTRASQCRPGQGCLAGVCGLCTGSIECFGGICMEGSCTECTSEWECSEAYGIEYFCDLGICRRTTCLSDVDCIFSGELCSAETFECVPCTSSLACLESTTYGNGHQCLSGMCLQGNCNQSSDCPWDNPICGSDKNCRGCVANDQGPDGECLALHGQGWLCVESGPCVQGNCLNSADCGPFNQGLCQIANASGVEGPGVADVADFNCRPCVDMIEDELCRSSYGLDDLICQGGKCIAGCTPGLACGDGLVCTSGRWCVACQSNTSCSSAYSSDYLCNDGVCIAAECNAEKPCTMGLVCDSDLSFCRDCEAHSECPLGSVCDLIAFGGSGRCRTGECTQATQQELCASGLCKSFACVPCGEAALCGPSWDEEKRVCDNGICVLGECTLQNQATACVSALCKANTCANCVSLADCGPNRICDLSNHWCLSGNCIVKEHCGQYPGTLAGQVCDLVGKTCRNCSGANQSLADQDCISQGYPAGTICSEGLCQQGCTQHSGCPSNYCKAGYCIACKFDSECGVGRSCHEPSGVCVEGSCAVDADCPAASGPCRQNRCQLLGAAFSCLESDLPDNSPCNDGEFCTLTDICDAGVCVGLGSPCDDSLSCTQDNCSGAVCGNHIVNSGWCTLDGTCRQNGESHPLNGCLECRSDISQVGWTPDNSNSCGDDGNDCTNEVCSAGVCTHPITPKGTPCHTDSVACTTTDSCDAGVCVHAAQDALCDLAPSWLFEACEPELGGCASAGWGLAFGGVLPGYEDGWALVLAILATGDSFVYVSGMFRDTVDFDPTSGTDSLSTNNPRGFISKYSQAGTYLWTKAFGGGVTDIDVGSLAEGPDGSIIIAGKFEGTGDFNPGNGVTTLESLEDYNGYVLKLTGNGSFAWALNLVAEPNQAGVLASVSVAKVIVSGSELFMAGRFSGLVDFDPGLGEAIRDSKQGADFLAKFTSSGQFVMVRTWDLDNINLHYGVEGQLFLSGKFGGVFDVEPGNPGLALECDTQCDFVVQLNAQAQFVASRNLGQNVDSVVLSVLSLEDLFLGEMIPGTGKGARLKHFGSGPLPIWSTVGFCDSYCAGCELLDLEISQSERIQVTSGCVGQQSTKNMKSLWVSSVLSEGTIHHTEQLGAYYAENFGPNLVDWVEPATAFLGVSIHETSVDLDFTANQAPIPCTKGLCGAVIQYLAKP